MRLLGRGVLPTKPWHSSQSRQVNYAFGHLTGRRLAELLFDSKALVLPAAPVRLRSSALTSRLRRDVSADSLRLTGCRQNQDVWTGEMRVTCHRGSYPCTPKMPAMHQLPACFRSKPMKRFNAEAQVMPGKVRVAPFVGATCARKARQTRDETSCTTK